jgi:hypothetical protein
MAPEFHVMRLMSYARLLLITMFATSAAALSAAAQSICNPCVDGPEMFEHRRLIEREASVPRARCGIGAIRRTYGGSEWVVSECDDGRLVVSASTGTALPYSFTFAPHDRGHRLVEQDPRTPGERAAYAELRALSSLEIAALVAEVRVNACRSGAARWCGER